jgi:hypothetical protein
MHYTLFEGLNYIRFFVVSKRTGPAPKVAPRKLSKAGLLAFRSL